MSEKELMKCDAKRDVWQEALDAMRDIKAGRHGAIYTVPSVKSIREKAGLSQSQLAGLLGISVRTLQDWEQNRRAPSGAARSLLTIAAKRPDVLRQVFLIPKAA